ncbi:hypothetical protein F5878DRAFT_667107 [Lentinula raphanica]|uniref:SWIM-type domain-containing protein n=1 Tax=Lentinula raphanica TaxID=153919 RepID=A0AA38NWP3_9AGAR|nr:hypothetical protein F5878DRAFT_667107 [Lentinula raphanica]
MSLIESKQIFLQNIMILTSYPEGKRAAEAGLEHFQYLNEFWMRPTLSQSWSEWGRLAAAAAIKIPVEGIILTTNHLESFNMVLKKKYIQQHLHSGHCLRFDLLIILLITEILPKEQERMMEQSRFHSIASGVPPYTFTAGCASSHHAGTSHFLQLGQTGEGLCTCIDFSNKGGACKHLRAFHLIVDGWASRSLCGPFHYPTSPSSAREIKQKSLNNEPSIHGNATQNLPPTIPLKDDVLEQWVNLQAVAQDRTVFEGLDEEEEQTNFGRDLDEEEPRSQVFDYVDSPNIFDGQRDAVNAQIGHCIMEEVASLLPRLRGLETLMNDAMALTQSAQLLELDAVLCSITSHISTATLENSISSTSSTPYNNSEQADEGANIHNVQKKRRCKRAMIRAPSPEENQKRKKSHGTL